MVFTSQSGQTGELASGPTGRRASERNWPGSRLRPEAQREQGWKRAGATDRWLTGLSRPRTPTAEPGDGDGDGDGHGLGEE